MYDDRNACSLAEIPFMVGRGCLEVYLPLVSQLRSWNYCGLTEIFYDSNSKVIITSFNRKRAPDSYIYAVYKLRPVLSRHSSSREVDSRYL